MWWLQFEWHIDDQYSVLCDAGKCICRGPDVNLKLFVMIFMAQLHWERHMLPPKLHNDGVGQTTVLEHY